MARVLGYAAGVAVILGIIAAAIGAVIAVAVGTDAIVKWFMNSMDEETRQNASLIIVLISAFLAGRYLWR